jgi:phosphoribosylglycinamide formyltransferase-1
MLRIGVLASHEGTTLQSIIDACAQRRINGRVVAVVSNNGGSGALRRAAAKGIETFHLSSVTHPSSDALDAAILQPLQHRDDALEVFAVLLEITNAERRIESCLAASIGCD